jgi:ribosomal 50S subunit-recycling heat shock protein
MNVRIDLFLKTSRLVKRRAVAREMCDGGRVLVNGREARPAKEVKQGDAVTLMFPSRSIELEVLAVPVSAKKPIGDELYRIIADNRMRETI